MREPDFDALLGDINDLGFVDPKSAALAFLLCVVSRVVWLGSGLLAWDGRRALPWGAHTIGSFKRLIRFVTCALDPADWRLKSLQKGAISPPASI